MLLVGAAELGLRLLGCVLLRRGGRLLEAASELGLRLLRWLVALRGLLLEAVLGLRLGLLEAMPRLGLRLRLLVALRGLLLEAVLRLGLLRRRLLLGVRGLRLLLIALLLVVLLLVGALLGLRLARRLPEGCLGCGEGRRRRRGLRCEGRLGLLRRGCTGICCVCAC